MRDFVEYIASLAPEGETTLIVKQKPRLVNGEQQFHADGALRCTWPSFLPERWSPGGSWYGNTGSFIISRFKNGRTSASAANCTHVWVLLLDDVGTKSKVPPDTLLPTWVIETSPGNFQWGFVFQLDAQPTTAVYSAAIKAIAAAGYTDGGAINPVRNFRLPGSINLKPGKGLFEAKLIGLWRDREHTLEGICEALGVVPGEPDGGGHRGLSIGDDGNDDVLAWATAQGQVLEGRNADGWYGVVCPNAEAHSDGNSMGRYLPATRGYCCFHEHCCDWDSARYLAWVEAQGGPKHAHGLREELLAIKMESALAKISPSPLFSKATTAAEVIAEVERKELGRIEKEDWYGRFAYIQDAEAFFDLIERRELSRATFNAIYRHVKCKSIRSDRQVEASICFDENRQAKGAKALIGITYAAGDSALVAKDGAVYGNKWINARPQAVPGDVGLWLALAERLIPDDAARGHVFDVLAHKLQFPKIKINHAILHAGAPGIGKDTFYAAFLWAIGGPDKSNIAIVSNEALVEQWGYHLESEVMVINELRQTEAKDRRALENTLKPVIAAPPELLPVNRKGLHPYTAVNRILVLAFSNERAAIAIPTEDRRWFVLWSSCAPLPEADALKIWAWYAAGGYAAVAAWLYARDVSAFNPSASPERTEAKEILIEQSRNSAEAFALGMIQDRAGDFAKGVVASPYHALCDRMNGLAPTGVRVYPAALYLALREAGWLDIGHIASRDYKTKKQLFALPDMVEKHSKSDLRRMVEEPPVTTLVRVK